MNNKQPIEIAAAFQILDQCCRNAANISRVESILIEDAAGRCLANDLIAPFDHPPFDQSLRDGIAFSSENNAEPLQLAHVIHAGVMPQTKLAPNQAVKVMTGAPLPEGADAVEMIENVRWSTNGKLLSLRYPTDWETTGQATHATVPPDSQPGQFVLSRGSLFHTGQAILQAGHRLTPQSIGLLASTGHTSIQVKGCPTVSLLTTGDEVISADSERQPGQIFNSNGPMLCSEIRSTNSTLIRKELIADQLQELRRFFQAAVEDTDLIVTTGGVSAGEKDYLPGLFQEFGFDTAFHGIRMKPGKPIWFGHRHQDGRNQFALGLPGNPVSCFVGFQLFGKRILAHLNRIDPQAQYLRLPLENDFSVKGNRLTFWPGFFRTSTPWSDHPGSVRPLSWQGSPDLRTPAQANCLLVLDPTGPNGPDLLRGQEVWVLPC